MEINNALLPGAGGLILGLLLGVAIAGSGGDADKARLRETKALSEKITAMETNVAGLGDRIGGIETSITTQAEGVAALGPKIDAIAGTVQGGLDKVSGGVSEAVKTEIAGLKSDLASLTAAPATTPSSENAAAAPAAEPVEGEGVAPGATVVFDKDKMRVFVSSADPEAGTARVAVNGRDLIQLKVKEPFEANGCTIELNGFNADGQAVIGGGC